MPSQGKGGFVASPRLVALARADGLLIEVRPTSETAQSDGLQSLKPTKFQRLMDELRPLAVGRRL